MQNHCLGRLEIYAEGRFAGEMHLSSQSLSRQTSKKPAFLEGLLCGIAVFNDWVPGIESPAVSPDELSVFHYFAWAEKHIDMVDSSKKCQQGTDSSSVKFMNDMWEKGCCAFKFVYF